MKKRAAAYHFTSSTAIADQVVSNEVCENPVPTLPSIENLASAVNRSCKKIRLVEPRDLDFKLPEGYKPQNFFQGGCESWQEVSPSVCY